VAASSFKRTRQRKMGARVDDESYGRTLYWF